MTHRETLENPKYENWMKAGLALKYLHTGLSEFVQHIAVIEHQKMIERAGIATGASCTICNVRSIKPIHRSSECPRRRIGCNCALHNTKKCPNNICDTLYDEIMKHQGSDKVYWNNSDIRKWTTDPWEVAKCYIYGIEFRNTNSAAETEVGGLLQLFINTTKFKDHVNCGKTLIFKIRSWRNSVFHSPLMELEDRALADGIANIIAFLEDDKEFRHYTSSKQSVLNLKKLQIESFKITTENESDVVKTDIVKTLKEQEAESSRQEYQHAQGEIIQLQQPKNLKKRLVSAETTERPQQKETKRLKRSEEIKPLESILPMEILRMDEGSIELYKKALSEGKVAVHSIRVMVVGHYGVGKTTLTRRLFGEHVVIGNCESTEGIEVHVGKCKIDLDTGSWSVVNEDKTRSTGNQRLAKVVRQTLIDGQEPSNGLQTSVERQESEVEPGIGMVQEQKQAVIMPMPEEVIYSRTNKDLDKGKVLTENDDVSSSESRPSTSAVQDNKLKNRNEDEDRVRTDLQKFVHESKELPIDDTSRSTADLSVWDFAGQYAFYSTHQVFLSRRAIYLLVTDISKHVNDVVRNDDCYFDSKGAVEWKISEYVNFWLNSIHEFCTSDATRIPPVILVGTFVDKLKEETKQKKVDSFFHNLRCLLVNKVIFKHLTDKDFHIDNKTSQTELEPLRAKILEIAKAQDYWGELIPAKWITLENKLLKLKEEGQKVIEKSEVVKRNSALPVPITSLEEIELFLNFHHESGNLIYFCKDEDLNKTIVLDPQWLIDAFKCLITDRSVCSKQSEILKMWIEFNKTAILRKELIDAVWKTESRFKDHIPLLLLYLEKLGLLAKPCRPSVGQGHQVFDYYFAPSVLKETPPLEMLTCATDNGVSSSILCFTTPSRFVPTAVFNKLMAVCIDRFTLTKQNDKGMIYCGCGVFTLRDNHRLHLLFVDSIIKVWIIRYSSSRKQPEEVLCQVIKNFIQEFLKKELPNVQTYVYVKCPHGKGFRNEKKYQLEDLVQREEVLCECHHDPHPLETKQFTKYWCTDKRCEYGEEPTTRPAFGNFVDNRNYNGLMIPMKEVHCTKDAGECVCQIVFPFKGIRGYGTGFRVGYTKIMTAGHIVDMIKQGSIMTGIKKATNQYAYLTADGVEAIFGYYESNSNAIKRFKFKPTVHFWDDKLDVAVLELDVSENETVPNAFLKFSRPVDIPFKLVGHPATKSMLVDNDKSTLNLEKEREKIKYAKSISKKHSGKEFDCPPWNTVDDHRKVLFHCKFSYGASGSPGVCIDASGCVYVVTMLLCGYPLWLYDTSVEQSKKNSWHEELTFEQGVNMESVFEEMEKTCPELSREIFSASK